MAKEIINAAWKTASESTLEQLLPAILKRFDDLHQEIAQTCQELAEFRSHVDAKFERSQELMNKLGLRINTVETKVDMFMEFSHRVTDKSDNFLECLVRVEEGLKNRQRRAG